MCIIIMWKNDKFSVMDEVLSQYHETLIWRDDVVVLRVGIKEAEDYWAVIF